MNARSTSVILITLVLLSSTAALHAAVYSWETATSGDWDTSAAWAPDGVPGSVAGDTVTIDVAGVPYTVTLDVNIHLVDALSAFTLDSSDATFSASGKTLTVDGPSNLTDGSVTWQASTWTGTGTLTNDADMTIRGASTISTAGFVQNGTVLIEGGSIGAHATLMSAGAFDNSGTITLDSTHASYQANLTVSSGTLTNTASGVINVNKTLIGAGTRTIYANLANNGQVNINTDTTFSKTSGQYTNDGDFNIATDKTLAIGFLNQVFNQNGGTLDIDGTMALTSIDFTYNGGTISGTPTLTNVDLTIAPGATNGATFLLRGASSTLSGDVHAGQVLMVKGGAGAHATLTSAGGFDNSGEITLDSTHGSYQANLTVSSGTLTNTALGVINVDKTVAGTGTRTIYANLANNGQVNINTDTTFSKTSGQYTNDGDFNIATDKTLAIGFLNQVFNQNGGTLDIDGTMALTSIDFTYNGGTISGTPTLTNVDLTIAPGATNGATFLLRGASSTLSGDVHAGQVLMVQGHAVVAHATLMSAGGFDNSGEITLDSTHGSYQANLTVTSGTLTNTALGVINANKTVAGTGTRTIYANLANNGQVNINTDTTFSKTSGQYTNDGDFNIATDKTLAIGFLNQVFKQDGGTLDIDGTMALTSIDFTYNGGTISGTPTLTNVDLTIGAGATNGATFLLRGASSTLSGDVHAGQVLMVQGHAVVAHATLMSAGGFDNSGEITLDSTHGSYQANLTVTSGTLTNTALGVINVDKTVAGTGTRTITANLTNNGQVNINTDTTLTKASGQHINSGDLNIALDNTLTLSGSSVNFTNAAGGTIAGEGTLNLGTATFANDGRIAPGMSPGILAITGDVPFSGTAEFAVEIFGLTVGSEYDRLDVSGQAALDGKLIVELGSFIPDPSDSFTIMTAGELSDEFDNTPGGVLALVQGTADVFYDYDADTVTLRNFQNVPEPTTMSLLALGGLALLRRRKRA